jgi:hypothetical protein
LKRAFALVRDRWAQLRRQTAKDGLADALEPFVVQLAQAKLDEETRVA